MNDIGIGIMCFGADKYFEHTQMLIDTFVNFNIYILTDNPSKFPEQKNIIKYDRTVKSYHDKLILPKEMLRVHDTCFIMDADSLIKDATIAHDLLNYPFQEGITYIDNLQMINYNVIGDIQPTERWIPYLDYIKTIYPEYYCLETIHEYFMVFKRDISYDFFKQIEKLQIMKECGDVKCNKQVLGAGEGISIQIAANITKTPIRKDLELKKIIEAKILNLTQAK